MIKKRFEAIKTPDDFVLSNEGVTLLDSISMRLQVVGELLKKIDKHDNTFLNQYLIDDIPRNPHYTKLYLCDIL